MPAIGFSANFLECAHTAEPQFLVQPRLEAFAASTAASTVCNSCLGASASNASSSAVPSPCPRASSDTYTEQMAVCRKPARSTNGLREPIRAPYPPPEWDTPLPRNDRTKPYAAPACVARHRRCPWCPAPPRCKWPRCPVNPRASRAEWPTPCTQSKHAVPSVRQPFSPFDTQPATGIIRRPNEQEKI